MKGKWLTILVLPLFFMGCLAMEPLKVREEKYGKNIPVITNSFASKEIRPGATWKVYLAAKDDDGDMKNIFSSIDQPGVGTYPISITRIKPEDQRELSGYIFLFTANLQQGLNMVNFTLNVQIGDQAGHYSAPVSFPLSFNELSSQEPPPKDAFKEKDLGPIMIRLRTLQDGTGTGNEW
jgi:hypothetical protein